MDIQGKEKEINYQQEISRVSLLLQNIGEEVLAIRILGNLGSKEKKDFTDIVTRADIHAEKRITAYIRSHYPTHGIRGEEGTRINVASRYEWIVDPIDGTTNFAKGMDLFGISVGIVKDNVRTLGIMHFPVLKKTAWAIQGKGAYINDASCTCFVRVPSTLKDSLIVADLTFGKEYLLASLRKQCLNVLSVGSFTVESLWLIEGKIDALVHTGATPYDMAAASFIAEETGCVISGVETDAIDMRREKIPIVMAKSPALLREVRDICMSEG